MDTPSIGQSVRLLSTQGKGTFYETNYNLQPLDKLEIRVRAVMTGVCRSDIDMAKGVFPLLPESMHGHEGLGQVIERGPGVHDYDIKVGDYVATRGEPAYADYYNCKPLTWVKVPEADPKYIIEPVACAVNIETFCLDDIVRKHHDNQRRMLIIGSGFLAKVFYQCMQNYIFEIDVWGNADKEFWGDKLVSEPNGSYDIVVDLKDTKQVLDVEVNDNPLIILCSQKQVPIATDFSNWLWKSATIKMPSPRAPCFLQSMRRAVSMVQQDTLTLDNVWTHSYNRDTNWQKAFTDANDRPKGYGRGYIKWD